MTCTKLETQWKNQVATATACSGGLCVARAIVALFDEHRDPPAQWITDHSALNNEEAVEKFSTGHGTPEMRKNIGIKDEE